MSIITENRLILAQKTIDRLVPAHDKNVEFAEELLKLLDKYPLNYEVKYDPKEFVIDETEGK